MHQRITDRKLQSLKPRKQRYEVMDTDVRGFGVRVSDSGHRSFILVARYPGSKNPTRRHLGDYPELSLEAARKKATRWRELIAEGKDPRDEAQSLQRAELRKRADTFEAAVEEYAKRVLPKQRRGQHVARELRQVFGQRWAGRPITSIERRDVIEVINEVVDRGAPYQAHNLFSHLRSMYNWVVEDGRYGIEHSPCDRIQPKRLIGARKPRQRALTDVELRAFWHATESLNYPFGPLLRLLLLTGCRRSEIGGARWREIDLSRGLLTIPPERFKADAEHLVPLTTDALAILKTLPHFTKGDCLFSSTMGERPVTDFMGAKRRIDRRMVAELGGKPAPFRFHDLRRTMRTRLAALRVPDTVAEMVIGHGRKGIQRVYDVHQYGPEMREALELWAARLRDIVTPPPDNVVRLKKEPA